METYSPKEDSWQLGIPYPPRLTFLICAAAVQQVPNSFILLGGLIEKVDNIDLTGDIYHIDESGFKIIKENVLVEPREWHVAMAIPSNHFSCAN